MTKYLVFLLLFTFPFLGTGCQEIPYQSKEINTTQKLTFTKTNGTLKVTEGGESCLLAEDAIDYETYVSPDAGLIAVETLLLSDLQIIRVYRKGANNCFRPLPHPLSSQAWHTLAGQKGFAMEEVDHPRMKFLKWVDTNTLRINLSGETQTSRIDENMTFKL